MKFLSALRPEWNISLCHYRNQGADYGRILVGLQVPTKDQKALGQFLKQLGYSFVDETNNPAFQLFLKRG
jgi:threonine dehydratase